MHINKSSILSKISELGTFANLLYTQFDIIYLTKNRLFQKISLTGNIDFPIYNAVHAQIDNAAGGAVMYIYTTV